MSILANMAVYSIPGQRSRIFEPINAYIEAKIKTVHSSSAQREAEELEGYFQTLKDAIRAPEESNLAHSEFVTTIRNILGENNFYQLFQYDSSLSSSSSGNKFEEDLVTIINSALNMDLATKIGDVRGTSDLLFTRSQLKGNYDKWVDVFSSQITDGVVQWVLKDAAAIKSQHRGLRGNAGDLYRLGKVQGKVDLMIPSTDISVFYDLSPDVFRFAQLIHGHNITAKNYVNTDKINFGNTKRFRIYATFLPVIGLGQTQMLQAYYIYKNAEEGVLFELATYVRYVDEKIRLYYEITGEGISYDGIKIGPADLVIANDRYGRTIRVYNSYLLLEEKFEDIKKKYSQLSI